MASIVKSAGAALHPRNWPSGTSKHRGFKGFAIDKGQRAVFAGAFGYAKGYYGEKFIWKGHGADLWLGVGAFLLSSFFNTYSSGSSSIAKTLERVGDAGVMSAANSYGAAMGLEKSGNKVAVITEPGMGLSRRHQISGDIVGAIAGAKAGPYLTPEAVANFAKRR